MFWAHFFEGYGLVIASNVGGSLHFIYLAGDPPDSVRHACEAQENQFVPPILIEAQEERPGCGGATRTSRNPIRRVFQVLFEKIGNLLLKWSHAADSTPV
jgi:hypothetical protein